MAGKWGVKVTKAKYLTHRSIGKRHKAHRFYYKRQAATNNKVSFPDFAIPVVSYVFKTYVPMCLK